MKYLGQPQSGSQANTTASHNRAGQYLRSRRAPVSPTRTPKQGILRGKFGSASAGWQSLDATLQSAWTAFAAGYPVVDALGQSVVLTGQQYFIGLQTSLMNAGQPMDTIVPTNTNTPAIDTPTIYADANGTLIVSVASIVAGDWNVVGCSKVLSNGVNFNKQFSQFAVLNTTVLSVDISAVYTAQYGAPVLGRKIFARFKEVNSSGMSGPDLILQASVITPVLTVQPTTTNAIAGTVVSTAAGTGTLTQQLWQITDGSGIFTLQQTQPSVMGVATFTTVVSGLPTFTRSFDGTNYGPPSATFTSI